MVKVKKFFRLFMVGLLGLVFMSSVFANSGLNLKMVAQTPDPVEPGKFVYVSVQVSN